MREAVSLAFNFEWINESLQYGLFKQRVSFTQDTPLMATGVAEGAELELLKRLGDVIAPEMLTEEARMPHTSSADRLLDRRNARQAFKLLDEAGWPVGDDGKRRNAAGEPLRLTFLLDSSGSATLAAVVENFMSNLESFGIEAVLERVDSSQYTSRERDRDYDLVYDQYAAFLGTGTGLSQRYGSEAASFSLFNPAGLASPMVDAIIEASLRAETREEEEAAMTALDRALRHEFIMVQRCLLDCLLRPVRPSRHSTALCAGLSGLLVVRRRESRKTARGRRAEVIHGRLYSQTAFADSGHVVRDHAGQFRAGAICARWAS